MKLKTELRRHNGLPLNQEESTNMEMGNQESRIAMSSCQPDQRRDTENGNSVGFFFNIWPVKKLKERLEHQKLN